MTVLEEMQEKLQKREGEYSWLKKKKNQNITHWYGNHSISKLEQGGRSEKYTTAPRAIQTDATELLSNIAI